jgi:hypothetical protein
MGFFRVSSFFYFFGFLSGSEFFWVSDFFGFQVHPRVKNKTRTQTQFCVDWVQIQVTGAKMHLNPHLKPTGYPKHEPELPYLTAPLPPIASNFKLFAIIGLQGIGFSIALEPALLPNSIIFS